MGTFSELLAKNGVFFTLYELQKGGFQEFLERLQVEFSRYQRYHQELSLLLLSVNEYDRYAAQEKAGRMARLMGEVNLFVRKRLRLMDFSSVFMDDKILIGLPQTPLKAARSFGQRIQTQISRAFFESEGKMFNITATMRAVSLQEHPVSYAEGLIEQTELARPF
jgi:GGDEF domain-containing protein